MVYMFSLRSLLLFCSRCVFTALYLYLQNSLQDYGRKKGWCPYFLARYSVCLSYSAIPQTLIYHSSCVFFSRRYRWIIYILGVIIIVVFIVMLLLLLLLYMVFCVVICS